jgi:hypothetical protein
MGSMPFRTQAHIKPTKPPTKTMKQYTSFLAIAFAIFGIQSTSFGSLVNNWINWTAPSSYPGGYASSANGSILMPDSSTVGVTFSGEILPPDASAFGTNDNSFWSTENYLGTTYLSSNVPTLPSNSDRVAVNGVYNVNQLLTFSSPVSNLVMNVWSLGSPGNLGSWQFNRPFVILSENNGQWPSAPFALDAPGGNRLDGYEGSGTIQFTGTFSTLSWEILDPENYAVWNIGVTSASAPSAVPEPGQAAASLLLLAGIGGYVFVKRRKAAKPALAQTAA